MRKVTTELETRYDNCALVKIDGELMFVFQVTTSSDGNLTVQILRYPDGEDSEQFEYDTIYSGDGRKRLEDRM